jgi:hypothetical protein
MVAAWLDREVPPGSWVLDPFGSHPLLALEAARKGYRVLVTSNNPVLTFLLEVLATAPQPADFQSVLAALALLRRGEERLEKQIQQLYLSNCAACGAPVQPSAFLWQRGAAEPFARIYRCAQCGDEGERPVTSEDLERLARIGNAPLAVARAVERMGALNPEQKEILTEALKTYPTRPLYVLFTLLNKAEGIDLPPARKRLLTALLLSLCDHANTLWPYPAGRARPRQLTVPPQFRENNLWLELEACARDWTPEGQAVPLARWPEVPPATGGITVFPGRLRSLLPLPPQIQPAAVLAAFPRPNQAFWTLSAMWSGWLWGKEAVTPLKSALDRLRYDWYWHANALNSVLSLLRANLPAGTRLFGVATETYPGLLLSILASARTAGFQILGMALRNDEEIAQFTWRSGAPARALKDITDWEKLFREAMQAHLEERGEPAHHTSLFAACLAALIEEHALPLSMDQVRTELSAHIQNTVSVVLRDRSHFRRISEAARSSEGGEWWLENTATVTTMPLADRVEMEVVRWVQKHPEGTLAEVDQAICNRFTGLNTPARDLVVHCLDSYTDLLPPGDSRYRLRPGESPEQRRQDIDAAIGLLAQLGEQLGFAVSGSNPFIWQKTGKPAYTFHLLASCVISRFFLNPASAEGQRVLVIPGSRSRLFNFKLNHDPRLAQVLSRWRILKFRHLRRLAERPYLTPEIWNELLDQDQPLGEDAVQMRMF